MHRRHFLALTGAAAGTAAVGGAIAVFDNPYDYIPALLHEYIGEYTMAAEEERRFIDAFGDHYGLHALIGFVGLHNLRRHTAMGTQYTHYIRNLYERRLVGDFMSSTDFMQKSRIQKVPDVKFIGFNLPCSNPFARFAQ